jgi:hypothetical protein
MRNNQDKRYHKWLRDEIQGGIVPANGGRYVFEWRGKGAVKDKILSHPALE